MEPKQTRIEDFDYPLPDERIARYPLPERDQSRLLVYRNGQITTDQYAGLARHLPANSLLIFNNTRVVAARLLFQNESGARIEIFCLEPGREYADITSAMLQKQRVTWKCLVGNAKKWKQEQLVCTIRYQDQTLQLTARKIAQLTDHFEVQLHWDAPELSFAELLQIAGLIPLPPYLKREAEPEDANRYQTIYAREEGSVAAPTAGLHFTEKLLQSLTDKNIRYDFLTLHVGAGTFKPVSAATMQDHDMHAEFIEIDTSFLERLTAEKNRIRIAVGTTSLRTLETLYWLGVKVHLQPDLAPGALTLAQWEVYELQQPDIPAEAAIRALQNWMQQHQLPRLATKTQLLIVPGYRFRMISALITNFHQPRSTLLLLVAAITGDDWRKIYTYALENNFRFLSYGDGSLLWLNDPVI
ncbi:MAG TPA: S-adenosylmethionine:tRNA ribosyltransferase-isomerase [Sediminibacterium sp.]|nr:S-adenosylmethionine:tRNA ribosyltransferase-isomerase [Sediminibacterium sp.]